MRWMVVMVGCFEHSKKMKLEFTHIILGVE